jgi:hypothetical protein
MNALLRARLTQEVKDAMVGHKRQGARNDYAITELTIKTGYAEAFKYLTINGYGSQSRKIEELNQKFDAQTRTLTEIIIELKEESKALREENKKVNEKIEMLYPHEVTRHVLNDKNEIETWTEKFNSVDEYVTAEKNFRKRVFDSKS